MQTLYAIGASDGYFRLKRSNPWTGAESILLQGGFYDDSGTRKLHNGAVAANLGLVSNGLYV